jgi:hypothetical protein
MSCDVQASAAIELYFYGELPDGERAAVAEHLTTCHECRRALEELSIIRAALAARPDVSGPPGGDWSGFMARLDEAVRREPARDSAMAGARPAQGSVVAFPARRALVPYFAMAALLALVTITVLTVLARRDLRGPASAQPDAASAAAIPSPEPAQAPDPALASLGEQHFERSKLVVLGLATKDPDDAAAANWAYERELATKLLNDTRLYRLAAEERGMRSLAGVMRDLELVLLQASMSEQPDSASLEQLQRLIRRRDLVTKMNVVYTTGPESGTAP